MRKRKSRKKVSINTVGVGVAAFALTSSLFIVSPQQFLFDAQNMMATAVGARASVGENQYNTLAQQLQEKEEALNEREATLAQQEGGMRGPTSQPSGNTWVFVNVALSFMLFILVGLNFYLDLRRRGTASTNRYLINAR